MRGENKETTRLLQSGSHPSYTDDNELINSEPEVTLLKGSFSSSAAEDGGQSGGGISWYFAVFLLSNAAIGAGLLNFTKAYGNAGGILVSSLIQFVI
jgi:hypothetical protein